MKIEEVTAHKKTQHQMVLRFFELCAKLISKKENQY